MPKPPKGSLLVLAGMRKERFCFPPMRTEVRSSYTTLSKVPSGVSAVVSASQSASMASYSAR